MVAPVETFEMVIAVTPGDIDELDHVNNVTYVLWVQDVAVAHWRAAAAPEDVDAVQWVVLRHEIDYLQAARLGDQLVLKTWVGPATRIRFERNTEIRRASDGVVLARAKTWWCPFDGATRRVMNVPESVRERFSAPK